MPAGAIPDGWKGLDVGPETAGTYADVVTEAKTVLWNGPMGMFELAPFAAGTRTVAEAVAACAGVHRGRRRRQRRGRSASSASPTDVDHVSTGGGASLEFIEQGDLPGLDALRPEESSVSSMTRTQADHRGQLEDAPRPPRRDPGGAEALVPARRRPTTRRATW